MKTTHLWGIYRFDQVRNCVQSTPLRTVIQASTKLNAQVEAERLGFDQAWAHRITVEEALKAEWIPPWLQSLATLRTTLASRHAND